MLNRLFIFLLLLLGLTSCEKIFHSNTSTNPQIIEEQTIDFTTVDAYPLLPECKKYTSREVQKDCFYQFLSKRIELALSKKQFPLNKKVIDTIEVKIIIDKTGKSQVKTINLPSDDSYQELKKAIISSIDSLPQIQPAIKAGIPVTTEFILPIIIKATNNE